MRKAIKVIKANKAIKANVNPSINDVTEANALLSIMQEVDEQKTVKTVDQLMNEVEVQFSKGNGSTIKTITADLQAYLVNNSGSLMARVQELGKGCGGRLLDETLVKYYAVTGKGLTKYDLQSILIASNCGRSDVNGYVSTFASNKNEENKAGCPSRVKRFKADGLFCVVPAIG